MSGPQIYTRVVPQTSVQRPGDAISRAAWVPRDRLAAVPEGAAGLLPEARGRGGGGVEAAEVLRRVGGKNATARGTTRPRPGGRHQCQTEKRVISKQNTGNNHPNIRILDRGGGCHRILL